MSNDLISRSALIETINKISFYSVHNGEFIEGAGLKDVAYYRERDIYRAIIDAPTVEERPKGKWINFNSYFRKCSLCQKIVGFDYIEQNGERFNFCPNCGADMRGEEE